MFHLAHISDVHLSPLPDVSVTELFSKRITGYVNWRLNRAKTQRANVLAPLMADVAAANPDHIAISGDLVNLALNAEFDTSLSWLKSIGTGEHISVIPGNHDAYVPGALTKACAKWRDYMKSDSEIKGFPFMRQRGPVAIIGVSSAIATLPFMASGFFGMKQAKRLAIHLRQAKERGLFRVVMIHHPPFRYHNDMIRRLHGIALFQKTVIEAGAELILHGHTHLASFNQIGEDDSAIPVIGVPAASQAFGGHKPAARWNQFAISGEVGAWNCIWSERGVVDDSTTVQPISERSLWSNGKSTPVSG
jgi:3',5'-cyclic AMP phosphodiesterase CpdA